MHWIVIWESVIDDYTFHVLTRWVQPRPQMGPPPGYPNVKETRVSDDHLRSPYALYSSNNLNAKKTKDSQFIFASNRISLHQELWGTYTMCSPSDSTFLNSAQILSEQRTRLFRKPQLAIKNYIKRACIPS